MISTLQFTGSCPRYRAPRKGVNGFRYEEERTEEDMHRTVRVLLLSATLLLTGGWFLYHHGSRVNHESGIADQALWEQAPGDKWLYIGGLMMLISGSLGAAAVL